jgi:excinuclease ABC subunit C
MTWKGEGFGSPLSVSPRHAHAPSSGTIVSVERPDLSTIPRLPGVYRWLGYGEEVLYVGKAKDLRARLSSYWGSDVAARIQEMRERAVDITWLTCASEAEALIVEASLIRSIQPPYNVKLRYDNHAYPYIALTKHEVPRVLTWHGDNDGVERFGPYPSPSHAHDLRETIQRVWQLRPCSNATLRKHTKLGQPCLMAELGRCCAPCVDPSGYQERVVVVRSLLDGSTASTLEQLQREMEAASANRAFEHAALVRDRIDAVRSLSRRAVPTQVQGQVDVVAVALDELGGACQLLRINDSALRGCPTFSFDDPSAIDLALTIAYQDSPPADVVLTEIDPPSAVLEALREKNPKLKLKRPSAAQELALVQLCQENAQHALSRARLKRADDPESRRAELTVLAHELALPEPPLRIECVDISHFQGENTVASFAVLEEGLPRPKAHRRMRLQDRIDDPSSIKEALCRRLAHLTNPKDGGDWSLQTTPQLILIDGGPAQLQAAHEAMKESGLSIPLASLSKRLEEVWRPLTPAPLRLDLDSPALLVLQRARDEAHRTSIRYQRSLRTLDKQLLDGIAGLGTKRQARLLEEAGSLRALRAWPKSRFLACSWLPRGVAELVFDALQPLASQDTDETA